MGTPDSFDGPSYEEGVIWEEQVSDPTKDKRLQYTQSKGLVMLDDGVVRAAGENRVSAWQTEVDERFVDTPPVSPTVGYRVIVGDSPAGDFVGHEGEIAHYNGSSWVFSAPRSGMSAFVKDQGAIYRQVSTSAPWSWNTFNVGGEPVGFPNRADSSISFVDGTRTFTISPAVSSFDFHVDGAIKYTKDSGQSVVITDIEGVHYVYFDMTGTLVSTTTWTNDIILKYSLVSIIYWDSANSKAIYIGDERHGLTMDGATHLHWHVTLGTAFYNGLALNSILADESGDLDTHAQLGTDSGTIADEDLIFGIDADVAPAQIPVFYRDGASGYWRRKTADNFPVYSYSGGSGLLAWNEWTGSTWQQTEVANNNFVLVHFFTTNDPDQPWIVVQGQSDYSNLSAAREGATSELNSLVLAGLPFVEFSAIATVIFQTSVSYSNSVKGRIRSTDIGDWVDWRYASISPSAPPQEVLPHKFTHEQLGSDELTLQDLGAGAAAIGKLLETDGVGGWSLVDYVPGLPTELNHDQSDALSSTTSTSYIQKLKLTTTSLSAGNYVVIAMAVLSGDRNNTIAAARLEQDDTTELGSMEVRLTTAYAEFTFYTHDVRALSGVHEFDIDFRFVGGSGSAYISNARIILWKVSDI